MSTAIFASGTDKKSGTAAATYGKGTEINTDDPDSVDDDDIDNSLVQATLLRLTAGLPKRELRLMVQESTECEVELLNDIRILEQALSGGNANEEEAAALSLILESPLTPLDRYWTASALLGRLRQDMALPTLLSVKTAVSNHSKATVQSAFNEQTFQELTKSANPIAKFYSKEIIPSATLLAVWKKIASNRAASVFKRPVRSEDAPGYTHRILFPMDLSLIRKRIVANNIQTYADLHAALGLISHNCVKYNGRETDYGRVARDFEAMADFYIFQAIQHYGAPPTENPPMTIVPAEVAPSTTTAEPLKVAPAEAEPPSTDDSQQPSTATTTTSATTSVPAS